MKISFALQTEISYHSKCKEAIDIGRQ